MTRVNRSLRIGCVLLAGLLTAAMTSRIQADVLEQIPGDAAIVIRLNHIADTNQKVAALLQQLGVTDLVPTMKDPLKALEDSTGFGPGIDTKGDAAAFFTVDDVATMGNSEPRGVVLLPVSDYKAFVGSMELVRTEGDTTVVHFKDQQTEQFIQHWGDYAAISRVKEALATKHDGLKAAGTAGKELVNDDMVLYTNFAVLRPMLLPKLDQGQQQLNQMIEKQFSDPGTQKVMNAAAKQLMQGVRDFVVEAQGSAVGITINTDGIKGSFTVDFTPDSYLGKLVATMKQTDGPLLAGLPKENYLVFGGVVYDPAWAGKVFEDMTNPIAAELPGMGDDGKKLADALATYKQAVATIESAVVGVVAPTGPVGQSGLIQEIFVVKGDSAKFKSSVGQGMDLATKMLNAFMQMSMRGQAGNAPAGDLLKMTPAPNFKTISGVAFDRWQIQVDPDNTSNQAMQLSKAFSTMYGPDGLSTEAGTIDPKTFVMGVGAPESVLSEVIDSSKSGDDVLSETVKEIDAQLPKKRAGVEYIGLGQYFTTLLNYVKAQGVPINITVPADLPPVGMAVSADGTSARVDGYIPVKLMQGLVQTGMQAYMQMQGRRNGGGGGGGGL